MCGASFLTNDDYDEWSTFLSLFHSFYNSLTKKQVKNLWQTPVKEKRPRNDEFLSPLWLSPDTGDISGYLSLVVILIHYQAKD